MTDTKTPLFETLNLPDADVRYAPGVALGRDPAALLRELTDTVAWKQEALTLWGRRVAQPRLTAWFGDEGCSYRYSGLLLTPAAWTPLLAAIRQRVEAAAGQRFNSVLLNLYRDQHDSISMHSDDEPELGPTPCIATLSLGAVRQLVLKHRGDPSVPRVRLALASGSLLLMQGPTQRHWKHGMPKLSRPCDPRMSLTFRRVHPEV